MKTTQYLLIGFLIAASLTFNKSQAQWAASGTHIYNTNAGNVGIGFNSPNTLLHVAKNMAEPAITVQNLGGSGGATFRMTDNVSGADWKFKATNAGGFKIRDNASSLDVITIEQNSEANAMYINAAGFLGIRTTTPSANLHVAETSPGNTAVFGSNISWYSTGTNVSIGDNNGSSALLLGQSPSSSAYALWLYNADPSSAKFKIGTTGSFPLVLQELGGNVGIGTTSPENSAILDISSSTKGFLPPRMTKTQIENIQNPTTGLIVFCTTDEKYYTYISANVRWKEILFGPGSINPTVAGIAEIRIFEGTFPASGSCNGGSGYCYAFLLPGTGYPWTNGNYMIISFEFYLSSDGYWHGVEGLPGHYMHNQNIVGVQDYYGTANFLTGKPYKILIARFNDL